MVVTAVNTCANARKVCNVADDAEHSGDDKDAQMSCQTLRRMKTAPSFHAQARGATRMPATSPIEIGKYGKATNKFSGKPTLSIFVYDPLVGPQRPQVDNSQVRTGHCTEIDRVPRTEPNMLAHQAPQTAASAPQSEQAAENVASGRHDRAGSGSPVRPPLPLPLLFPETPDRADLCRTLSPSSNLFYDIPLRNVQ